MLVLGVLGVPDFLKNSWKKKPHSGYPRNQQQADACSSHHAGEDTRRGPSRDTRIRECAECPGGLGVKTPDELGASEEHKGNFGFAARGHLMGRGPVGALAAGHWGGTPWGVSTILSLCPKKEE